MYLPPEWAPQHAVLLTWPHAHGDWGHDLPKVEHTFIELAQTIARYQTVIISCFDAAHREHVMQQFPSLHNIELHIVPSDDIWVRDHGPITVIDDDQQPVILDFQFNAWGNKYPYQQDNLVTQHLAQAGAFGNARLQTADWVLEGGGIEVNGAGTLLTTTQCLLNPNRNPDFTQADIEQQLKQGLGIQHIHWLENGFLAGDDTDGHIDTLARFVDANTICYSACNDLQHSSYSSLQQMAYELTTLRNSEGKPYQLIPLPIPASITDKPANYVNFLIINEAVLVPVYQDPADKQALVTLAQCFPDRKIIGIDCCALIQQNGSLHCATMQLPAALYLSRK